MPEFRHSREAFELDGRGVIRKVVEFYNTDGQGREFDNVTVDPRYAGRHDSLIEMASDNLSHIRKAQNAAIEQEFRERQAAQETMAQEYRERKAAQESMRFRPDGKGGWIRISDSD